MKILVVFTGGTIGSCASEDGYYSTNKNRSYTLLNMYEKKYGNNIEFSTTSPYYCLSEYLNGDNINKLIVCVKKEIESEKYDGIIVTHGTDTLQYSSIALGYCLGIECIPVVLVSSNYVLEDCRMNGLANFQAAVELIKAGEHKGVFVAYANKNEPATYHRATRVTNHNPYEDNLYSVCNLVYGRLIENIVIRDEKYKELPDQIKGLDNAWNGENSLVIWLNSYPGMDYENIDISKCKAILLSTYHSGTINTKNNYFLDFVNRARKSNVPIFLVGQAAQTEYESKKIYESLGIYLLPMLSPIAAYMKLCMIYSLTSSDISSDYVFENMNKSLGGDYVIGNEY